MKYSKGDKIRVILNDNSEHNAMYELFYPSCKKHVVSIGTRMFIIDFAQILGIQGSAAKTEFKIGDKVAIAPDHQIYGKPEGTIIEQSKCHQGHDVFNVEFDDKRTWNYYSKYLSMIDDPFQTYENAFSSEMETDEKLDDKLNKKYDKDPESCYHSYENVGTSLLGKEWWNCRYCGIAKEEVERLRIKKLEDSK